MIVPSLWHEFLFILSFTFVLPYVCHHPWPFMHFDLAMRAFM
jgi:hypothetical protein